MLDGQPGDQPGSDDAGGNVPAAEGAPSAGEPSAGGPAAGEAAMVEPSATAEQSTADEPSATGEPSTKGDPSSATYGPSAAEATASEPATVTTVAAPQFKPGAIAGAPKSTPESPSVEPLSYIRVGFTLALVFSGILAVYLLLALCSIWVSESRTMRKMDALTQGLTINEMASSAGQTNAITKSGVEALTKSLSEAYRDTRATTIEFHKTVIINVLLPIITALLGYLFANREKNEPNQGGK